MKDLIKQKQAVTGLRIVYPLWAVVGMFSLLYVPSTIVDKTDPQLTVENIINNETLFRLGISGSLITQLLSLVALWFLYRLFYQSYKEAFVIMAVFNFIGMPIAMYSNTQLLSVFDVLENPDQVMFLLSHNVNGTSIATIFWGLWLFPMGYMIIKSPLFPKLIGWLVVIGGVGYTVSAFAYFMGYKGALLEIMDYLTFGELIWMIWILIMGARWKNLE